MHRVFQSGARAEIDYCDGIDIFDPTTGEILKTELFVGVLCHSRYTFAEFSMSQKSEDFLRSHVRMFEFFGGVPEVVSPDNLKSAVTKAHKYDPVLNPAYTRLAEYYDVGVVPAQVRSPKHKAVVERTIQIFQRWFFATVRHRTFTSLVELNACLREHLEKFNNKIHRIFRHFVTQKDHYPEAQRAYCEATPLHTKSQAERIGPQTLELVEGMLSGDTPLKKLRRAHGIVNLSKQYAAEHIEEACSTALRLNQKNCAFIKLVLDKRGGTTRKNTKLLENEAILRGENSLLRGETLFH